MIGEIPRHYNEDIENTGSGEEETESSFFPDYANKTVGTLKQIWEKIRFREKLPDVHFTVFFSPHGSAKDLKGFEELLQSADIYIPENASWTAERLKVFQDVANGKIHPDTLQFPKTGMEGFAKKQMELLYNSRKVITFADVPRGHELDEQIRNQKRFNPAFVMKQIQSFPTLLMILQGQEREYQDVENKREQFILRQIPKAVRSAFKNSPELKQKQKLEVLLSLGAMHTPIFQVLKGKHPETTRRFNRIPFVYDYAEEVRRRIKFNKPIDQLLMAKMALEHMIYKGIEDKLNTADVDNAAIVPIHREILDQFSYEEIEQIFTQVGEGQDFDKLFNGKLRGKKQSAKGK